MLFHVGARKLHDLLFVLADVCRLDMYAVSSSCFWLKVMLHLVPAHAQQPSFSVVIIRYWWKVNGNGPECFLRLLLKWKEQRGSWRKRSMEERLLHGFPWAFSRHSVPFGCSLLSYCFKFIILPLAVLSQLMSVKCIIHLCYLEICLFRPWDSVRFKISIHLLEFPIS